MKKVLHGDVNPEDKIDVKVLAVTDEAFQLEVESMEGTDAKGVDEALFLQQDLSDMVVTSLSPDAWADTMADGKLDDYLELLTEAGGSIDLLNTAYGYMVWNEKEEKPGTIDDADRLSEDG